AMRSQPPDPDSRGEPIRTADHSHPKRVRYLAAPRPAGRKTTRRRACFRSVSARSQGRPVNALTMARVRRPPRRSAGVLACQLLDTPAHGPPQVSIWPRSAPRPTPCRAIGPAATAPGGGAAVASFAPRRGEASDGDELCERSSNRRGAETGAGDAARAGAEPP